MRAAERRGAVDSEAVAVGTLLAADVGIAVIGRRRSADMGAAMIVAVAMPVLLSLFVAAETASVLPDARLTLVCEEVVTAAFAVATIVLVETAFAKIS